MDNPRNYRYTQEHEWANLEGEIATMGITNYAATQLGDMVYVDMPTVGATISQGDSVGALESVKAAADFYSPLGGEVIERNERLLDEPGLLNSDPFGEGWFVRVRITDPSEFEGLMSADEYDEFEKSQG
ncbi:MAG: glycine cleavage system protein GcvH [Chloroflexota bacterium]|nr:glycine cleavage system protein GcvH [Chloroflexota bacterium]MDQ5866476.1 glycine cleavage system protein GcvH [Chloroflexota bacterium]